MTPSPIRKVLSTFRKHRVRALLMGGQACVFYGAAEFSRDTDFAILAGADNLARLDALLADRTPLPSHLEKELAVQSSTVTPFWWGIRTIVKYRTPRNYKDPEFLGPRVGDKLIMTCRPFPVLALAAQTDPAVGGRRHAGRRAGAYMASE